MTSHNNTSPVRCWAESPRPTQKFLTALKAEGWNKSAEENKRTVISLRREQITKATIFVGAGTCGLGAGAAKTIQALEEYIKTNSIQANIVETGCVGLCSEEPIMDVQLPGRSRVSFANVDDNAAPGILDAILGGRVPEGNVLGQFRDEKSDPWSEVDFLDEHPFLAPQRRLVLANSGIIDPSSIDEYIARGGYSALHDTLGSMTPDEVCNTVESSGLRGRGGGGFPAGTKWKFARKAVSAKKHLICNADEGDPGAFMDRAVCESDPHRLLEGMVIAAYAIGAQKAYIYIRAEYPLAIERLQHAIGQAESYGLLGTNILDSGYNLEIVIKKGAGAFVCGEETALIHSIEGKRGMPRPRPPFPASKGLFDTPTIINNVETLANVTTVMTMGSDGFSAIGTKGSKGTKVFALSGMVNRTGLVEVPMGTMIRDVVFQIGGGIPNNRKCKAVQIGGPSGGCIPVHKMDLPTDYEALKEFGAIMGSGGLVVMDESTCMVDLAKYFMEFIQSESCGKCIPCREGTRRMLEILDALTRSRKNETDIDALLRFQGVMYLQKLAEVIGSTSLCGLGQTASNPVLSTLRWFRDEYEAHLFERRCPAGACKDLVGAPCESRCPVDTEVWRYVANIADGDHEEAYRVVRDANPFPSACARVCHHPCETTCRCGTTGGDPIAVRTLKRFLVETVDPASVRTDIVAANENSKKVAVIGAGPSGLTAAHCLSAKGHKVTVFEKEAKPGGMLVCAIPEYRLPRETLAKEIDALVNDNVEIKFGTSLGRDITIDALLDGGYDAVYLAIGAHKSKTLGLDGEESRGVIPGIEFLKAYNLHGQELARGHVGIIGGGNSAIDAARVAIRQKDVDSVTVFYRRSDLEMPAYREEIEASVEEGVNIRNLVTPTGLLSSQGVLKGLRFVQNELGAPDQSGRRRPIPIDGTDTEVELNTLIAAIGEQPETTGIEQLELSSWGTLRTNPESFFAGRPGVFGGGDVVRGPNTVIDAVADGKNAAEMIDAYVSGRQLKKIKHVKLPSVYIAPVETSSEEEAIHRVKSPHLEVDKREKNFDEVELAIGEIDALMEARRCLRCDLDFTQPE